jgi:uncharacterized protein (TIGR00725 family)
VKRPLIIGVMGGSRADEIDLRDAYKLGTLIAQQGWVLLNGGRNKGIMSASAHGADAMGGLTIGILPDENASQAADHIKIPICTGMGSGRNIINVLSSDIVVACPGGMGTISEIALALKHSKRVITLKMNVAAIFKNELDSGLLSEANSPEQVIGQIRKFSS